jgi:hypothetical protein
MKRLIQTLAGGLAAVALLGLLARPCLGQGEPPTVGLTFEKWLAASVRIEFDAIECAPAKERCYRGGLFIYAGDADPPSVQWLSCQKWVTDWPQMAGVVAGDVAGTFAGEVLEATPSEDGERLHLIASYSIAAGGRTFSARVEGDQDNETGRSVLTGSVTAGWYRGAWVRAE